MTIQDAILEIKRAPQPHRLSMQRPSGVRVPGMYIYMNELLPLSTQDILADDWRVYLV